MYMYKKNNYCRISHQFGTLKWASPPSTMWTTSFTIQRLSFITSYTDILIQANILIKLARANKQPGNYITYNTSAVVKNYTINRQLFIISLV